MSALGAIVLVTIGAGAKADVRADDPDARPVTELRSADGDHALSFGGFLQTRFASESDDEAGSAFSIPRLRYFGDAALFDGRVGVRAMVGQALPSADALRGLEVHDAWVEWRAAPWARLRFGRFKLPVFREWVESSRLLGSVERSEATRALLPGRDEGLMLLGAIGEGRLEYAASLSNGTDDAATRDGHPAPAVAGRLVWNPTGRPIEGEVDFEHVPFTYALGGSAMWNPRATPGVGAHAEELSGGLELALRGGGFDFSAEAMTRRRRVNGTDDPTVGGYVRGDYYVAPWRLAFGGRVSRLWSPAGGRSDYEIDVGFYPGRHDLKIVVDYAITVEDGAPLRHGLRIQAQAAF